MRNIKLARTILGSIVDSVSDLDRVVLARGLGLNRETREDSIAKIDSL
jgi:hypothetical protein